jgi:hypothetical protein
MNKLCNITRSKKKFLTNGSNYFKTQTLSETCDIMKLELKKISAHFYETHKMIKS